MKRSAIGRTSIRRIAPGDPDPEGEPKRYANGDGFVRLRWKIGPREYLERYERTDEGRIVRTREPKPQKRIDVARAAELYASGLTQPEVAEQLGCDHGALSRALRRAGVVTRPSNSYRLGGDPARTPTESYRREFRRMRPLVRARSRGVCEAGISSSCTGRASHVHHRKLRAHAGPNTLENLLDVCEACHSTIHGNPARSIEHGLLVPSWADPAEVPVRIAAQRS